MNLHVDLPTREQVERLLESRSTASVSVYAPTDPVLDAEAGRIELGNLAAEALRQLAEAGTPRVELDAIEDAFADLDEDDDFWRFQARTLAVFATPEAFFAFRLPNRLVPLVEVSDRFHLKPLLRTLTFPQTAYVLALAQGSVRLLEVLPEGEPEEIDVPDLPSDVASAAGKTSIKDRSPSRRIQGSEGQKVRMRQYARKIDQALRPLLNGLDVPLVLAAAEPLESIYRALNTYPHLAIEGIPGSPDKAGAGELASSARLVLDALYAQELAGLHELYARRERERRASADVVDVARAATFGAVDTVFVDIDEVVPGLVDEETGAVTFGEADSAATYGVVDEIARRVWRTGGRVLAVRREDVPGTGSVAAILRYAI